MQKFKPGDTVREGETEMTNLGQTIYQLMQHDTKSSMFVNADVGTKVIRRDEYVITIQTKSFREMNTTYMTVEQARGLVKMLNQAINAKHW